MQPGWIMDLYHIRADYDIRMNTGKSILHGAGAGGGRLSREARGASGGGRRKRGR